jgi:hypothetical protein
MRTLCLVLALGLGPASCVGSIAGDQGGSTANDDDGPRGSGEPVRGAGGSGGTTPAAGGKGGPALFPSPLPPSRPIAPLRRLSRAQYDNTVRDLLGDSTRPADAFLADETPGTFSGSAAVARVSPTVVDQYRLAAERVAAAAVKNLATLLPCQPQPATEESCAAAFIDDFGLRAYRRPLAPAESASLLGAFRQVRAVSDFPSGIETIIAAALQSPYFLYRVDLPPPGATAGTVAPLGPYETASRLSYFFWNTMPDRDLFAAAKAGKLASAADVEAQAQRLAKDARVRDVVGSEFFAQWLKLGMLDSATKDTKVFKEWNDTLRRAMAQETVAFTTSTMFDGDGRLETLLTSSRSFVSAPLAALYGTSAGTTLAPANLNPAERAGVLTHASVLTLTADAAGTSPTKRGKFVRDQLMCQPPPPPPPNVDATLPQPQPGQSTRERYKLHATNPACANCHTLTDPLGFGLETYNAVGRFQSSDGGKPIDASGEITASLDIDGPFNGAVELARKLSGSVQVRRCQVLQWFRYAHGRPEDDGDMASVKAMYDAFLATGSLRDLMLAATRTDAFRSRLVEVAR